MVTKTLRLFYRVILKLITFVVVVMVLAALVIQFYVFPNIDRYKNDIAKLASEATQQKVEIGHIEAGWQKLNPRLMIANIDIYDAQNRPALQLKKTDVTFSWLSIPLLEPHLANLVIREPELTIRLSPNGAIYIAGISMEGQSKPDLPNWLLRQSQFQIKNAKVIWQDDMRNAPPLSLNQLNLQLHSPPWASLLKNHRISLTATPSIGTSNPIHIQADVYGNDVSQLKEWRGTLEASLKDADMAAFKPWVNYAAITHPIELQAGNGSAEVSLQFDDAQVQALSSKLALDGVKIKLRTQAEAVQLNQLSGKFNWINTTNSQKLNVENLTLAASNGLKIDNVTGSFTDTIAGNRSLNFKLPQVDLALIQPYLLQLPIPAQPLQKLTQLSPKGKLERLAFSWSGNKTQTNTYQIDTKFDGLSISAHEKIPGFSNLTGEINANQKLGKVTLHSTKALLDFKGILRWPIPADKLDGDITWSLNDQSSKIQIKDLKVSNQHLTGSLNASYLMDGNKGGLLDLKGNFGKGNAKYALFYYPTILGETTLHWLDTSILSGRAEDIHLTVKGRLADFPFVDSKNNLDSKLGLFRVTAKVSDSVLEFGTGWPHIEGLGLDLLFEGKRMELNANTGHLLGNQIIKSKTTIAQLDADSPLLVIDSEVKGNVENAIQFVNKSPVVTVTQGFTEGLKTGGQGKLNLNLKIPLQNVEASQYKGLYQIVEGRMESESIPTLININGALEFTESNLTAKNINASAFGSPVTLNLTTGKDKTIYVTTKGKISDTSLKQLVNSQGQNNQSLINIANYFSGSTDWTGNITIRKPAVDISIQSNLVGIGSRLPMPMNKASNEALNLRIDKKQTPNNETISVSLGNRMAAKLIRTGENGQFVLDGGVIQVNAIAESEIKPIDGIQRKGLLVSGNLEYLDGDAWRNVIRDISGTEKQKNMLPMPKFDLKINALDIFDRRINQLRLTNTADKDNLRLSVQSNEISGDLQWSSQNNGKLMARLSNLTVPEASPNRSKINDKEAPLSDFKKLEQDYPALDITAEQFIYNKKNFGALELVAYPQNDNWNIEKLKLIKSDSIISAEGQWNNWVKNPNTYLNITWDIKNLGKTLNQVGYPDTIKGGEGTLSAQLHWPGSPHQFNSKGLNGDLQLDLKKGQFLKVQPGVGRLLGLLSLQSLPRRLTLDFRDLFSNGFAFDRINGNAKISQGVMRSDNFQMSGPAADVAIKGETNLQNETQHLYVKVLPHVSDSLSLAALAGGPLAGAVAFLAQKILKDPLNKIASSEYEIIGTWDNPQEVNAPKAGPEVNQASPLQ